MERVVEPELLDELPVNEPRAVASRRDLRRLNWFMNHAGLLAGKLQRLPEPKRVLDIGAGDGTLALRLAQQLEWRGVEFVLLDRAPVVSPETKNAFKKLDCHVTVIARDVTEGLGDARADVAFANLFLHHFRGAPLSSLLANVATHTDVFIACEPRRSGVALLGSRLVGLLGCNDVTRHDALASVRAGFCGKELSAQWPSDSWQLREQPAGMFSHLFLAHRL